MLLALFTFGCVLTTPVAAKPASTQIVVRGLESSDIDRAQLVLVDGLIANTISALPGVSALTSQDVQRIANLEADKALMGCEADTCLAEVANALGARYVVFGRVGRLNDVILLQLSLFDSVKATAIGRQEVRAADVGELDGAVQPAVRRLLEPITGVLAEPGPSTLHNMMLWGGVIGAGVYVLAGAGMAGVALWQLRTVTDNKATAADRTNAKRQGAGFVAGGVGSVVFAVVAGTIAVIGAVIE